MKILRATSLGFCFGVRNALQLALAEARSAPLTLLGELVHNTDVLALLRQQGVQVQSQLEQVRTPTVMITAHGASDKVREQARARQWRILDATCPLVRLVHRTLAQLVAQGYHPVVIGQREHPEVLGLTGDLVRYDVILAESEVGGLSSQERFGVVAQTTQPIAHVRRLVQCVRERFPDSEVRFVDTVCQPTKRRQAAAVELAHGADVVVVVGGAHSNNTRQLAAACARHCAHVYHVENATELQPHWFAHADSVGITAGTSTPDYVIDEVEKRLKECAEQPATCLPQLLPVDHAVNACPLVR